MVSDQRTNGFLGARAALLALQRTTETPDLRAIDVGHTRMQQFRHLRSFEPYLQFGFPARQR